MILLVYERRLSEQQRRSLQNLRARRRGIAQLVEQRSPKPRAVGSSPTAPANHRGVAQLGSALDWGSRGRRFKSCHPDHLKNEYSTEFVGV